MISTGEEDVDFSSTSASISINDRIVLNTTEQGVTLAIYNANGCSLSNITTFDTYASVNQTYDLINYVESLSVGTSLLSVTYKGPEQYLSPAYPFLQNELGVNLQTLEAMGKFAFMARVGYSDKAILSLLPPGGLPVNLTIVT